MKNSNMLALLTILAIGLIQAGTNQLPWYYEWYKHSQHLSRPPRSRNNNNHYIPGGSTGVSVLAGINGYVLLRCAWDEYNSNHYESEHEWKEYNSDNYESKKDLYSSRSEFQKAFLGLCYLGLAGLMSCHPPE